jgi:hypothetical protein
VAVADLIGRVRALAQDAEDGGRRLLAERLRALADEAEARAEKAGRFLHHRPGFPKHWPGSVTFGGRTYWATGRWDVRAADRSLTAEYEASDGHRVWRQADGSLSLDKP